MALAATLSDDNPPPLAAGQPMSRASGRDWGVRVEPRPPPLPRSSERSPTTATRQPPPLNRPCKQPRLLACLRGHPAYKPGAQLPCSLSSCRGYASSCRKTIHPTECRQPQPDFVVLTPIRKDETVSAVEAAVVAVNVDNFVYLVRPKYADRVKAQRHVPRLTAGLVEESPGESRVPLGRMPPAAKKKMSKWKDGTGGSLFTTSLPLSELMQTLGMDTPENKAAINRCAELSLISLDLETSTSAVVGADGTAFSHGRCWPASPARQTWKISAV